MSHTYLPQVHSAATTTREISYSIPSAFELSFTTAGKTAEHQPLEACCNTPFENVMPAREFPTWRGQKHFGGLWWFASTVSHVGYESWLERDRLMELDADPDVIAVASQPFWLHWVNADGPRRHAPDFFARQRDGTGLVLDVRADDRIEVGDANAFAATATACRSVGWAYRRVGELDEVLAANLRWLSGYRHQRCLRPACADALLTAFAEPTELVEGVRSVGNQIIVLPVLFHLLWARVLKTDLTAKILGPTSIVRSGAMS